MKNTLSLSLATVVVLAVTLLAQNPPAGQTQQGQQQQAQQGQAQQGQRGGGGGGGQRGGGGGGRGRAQIMSLTTTAWTDGATMPIKFTQAGAEASPAIAWSGAPAEIASYALIVHD